MTENTSWQGDGHGGGVVITPPAVPTPARQVGPVTMATGGAAAVSTLVCGVLDRIGVELSTLEQGAVTVCVIMLAGWAVYPNGRRSK